MDHTNRISTKKAAFLVAFTLIAALAAVAFSKRYAALAARKEIASILVEYKESPYLGRDDQEEIRSDVREGDRKMKSFRYSEAKALYLGSLESVATGFDENVILRLENGKLGKNERKEILSLRETVAKKIGEKKFAQSVADLHLVLEKIDRYGDQLAKNHDQIRLEIMAMAKGKKTGLDLEKDYAISDLETAWEEEWVLAHVVPLRSGLDEASVILRKTNGKWEAKAGPGTFLEPENYPDVPKAIIDRANGME